MKNAYAAFLSAITYKYGAILYICLFCHQQTYTVIFIFFSRTIILPNVHFYIVLSMFPFLFNRSQSKVSVVNQMSHLFSEAQKYLFAIFNYFKMVIYRTLF